MQDNFQLSLKAVLREEGGNDDDPHDHGGRTSRGITQREWDAWRAKHPAIEISDVWSAPQDQIDAIYHDQYWEPYGDKMPSGVDLVFFDFAVNAGRQQAVKTLQRALNVSADGMMGIVTWSAVEKASPAELVAAFSERRRMFYRNLAQFSRYGKGWIGRTNRIEKEAASIAPASVAAAPITLPEGSAKANPEDARKPPILNTGTATTISAGGAVASGVSDSLQQASQAIQPLADTLVWVKYACLAITVICAGLAIYAIIHNNRMKEAI